ncbi:MAG: molecular chaperone TorD family protein [Dehalococcoidia bacterium]
MVTQTKQKRQEKAVVQALARSALYRLLSQALTYPGQESLAALLEADLPQAQQAAAELPADLSAEVAPLLTSLAEHLQSTDASQLQAEHQRVFTHILSLDCPPCETVYTCRDIYQETQDLSDIAGFFRAFGLEMAEKERLDHISVELEFMYFLAYKEAYALTHHSPAKVRLCRDSQRKFMQDHLGRWADQFTQRLRQKAGGGYFECVASLTEAFIKAEIGFLKAQPEAISINPDWRRASGEENVCPAAEGCP